MKIAQISIIPLFALIVSLSLVILYNHQTDAPESRVVSQGVLNAENWNFEKNGSISLEGEWNIYWNQLLTPATIKQANNKELIPVPLTWKKVDKPTGYATYHLSINGLRPGNIYSLKMMDYFSAFTIWVDDKRIGSSGTVGKSINEEKAQFDPQTVHFTVKKNKTDIIIQVSNYHYREGGIWYPPALGTTNQIQDVVTKQIGFEYILFFILLVIGCIHIGQYLNRRQDIVPLWFGLYCLTISFRSTAVGERIIGDWFPAISMELMMKSSFFWYYLSLPLFLRFISSLYSEEAYPRLNKYFTIFGIIFAASVLIFPAKIYSSLLSIFNGVMPILIVFVLITIVKAVYHKRQGAKLVLVCMTIYSFAISYDILVAQKIIVGRELTAYGLLIFVLSQSYVTFSKFSNAFHEVDRVQKELQVLNDSLDIKIKERTAELETSQKKLIDLNVQLEQLSYIDGLTNIANRRYFNSMLEEEWKKAEKNHSPISLLLMDVDYFKQYNDHYGHLMGDECLKEVADVLRNLNIKGNYLVARYGGEEFVILLPNTALDIAEETAQNFQQKLAAKKIVHDYSKINPFITASIGISTIIPSKRMDSSQLLAEADEALYQAKESGRNMYKFTRKTKI